MRFQGRNRPPCRATGNSSRVRKRACVRRVPRSKRRLATITIRSGQINLVVLAAADPPRLIAARRQQVQSVDKNLPLSRVETPAADLDEYLGDHRSLATLLSFFGGLALVLASIGLYGTMSYAVARRTKELGLRMALGARGPDIVGMVLRESLSLVALGIAFGIPAVAASKRVVASMLFGVKTSDPVTIS